MKALALDIGGSHASCALVNDREVVALKTISYSENESLMQVLPLISKAFQALIEESNLRFHDFSGLAAGFCGLVDTKNRRILSTKGRFADAHEIDLRSWCGESFNLDLYIENDARLALLGEWYAGSGRGSDDLVMMTLGTGVGGAAMIEAKLLRGKHFQAGCLGGHFPIQKDGRRCACGNLGCVEAYASTSSLPAVCAEWPGVENSAVKSLLNTSFGFRELAQSRNQGDRVAAEIFESCVKAWATGAVALIHAYDPDRFIIGGGVMDGCRDEIVSAVQKYVDDHAWTPWGKVQVRSAELGNRAALLGAVPLIEKAQS